MSEKVWGGEGEQSLTGVDSVSLTGQDVDILVTAPPGGESSGQHGLVLPGGVLEEVRHPGICNLLKVGV